MLLFSLTGDVIDPGSGPVMTLDVLPTGNGEAQACINDLVISDPSGVQMPANSSCGDLDVDGVSDDGGDDGSTDGGATGGTTGGGDDGDIYLSLNNVSTDAGYLELYMENSVDVGGFQFDLSGINITGASGGSAADAGFTLSTSESTVLGFSFTGNSIPSGEGVLVSVSFTGSPDEICVEDVVISDPFGVAIDVNLEDCWNSDSTDDGGDDGGDTPDPQYFTDLPVATGESSLIVIQSIDGIEIGDEIGVFDMNGVLETIDYPNTPEYGEVLVGSAVWTGSQAEIAAIMSIDLSDFNGPTLNGAVDGNNIVFRIWKSSNNEEYEAEANFVQGNGTFGQILTVVDMLTPVFEIEQSIELMPYMMNSISFNIDMEDSSVESIFSGIDLIVTSNDMSGFYVPELGVNSIGNVSYDMGLNTFISGADSQVCTMEGIPVDPSMSIELQQYMLNLISYLPSECMSTEEAFEDISDDIILVSDDSGGFYVPSLGVMTMTDVCPGEAYSVFTSSNIDFTYPMAGGQARSAMYGYWEDYNYSSQTRAYSDLVVPTGISYPVIITDIGGDVSVGDELVAYADGQVVGATRIVDLSAPVVISAWGGYHEFGIDLEGYDVGDTIDLRLFSNQTGEEMKVEMSLDNTEYGIGVLSSGTIEVMDMLAVPEEYNLTQNYPNPFNPSTTISFSIPSEGFVQVNVYDITGRLITGLVNGNLSAGYHDVIWDGTDMFGSNVSAGLYIYSLQAEGVSLTRKMVLMK